MLSKTLRPTMLASIRPVSSSTCFSSRLALVGLSPSLRLLSTANTSTHSSLSSSSNSLNWEEYLKLRRSRRLAGFVTTIPTTLLAATGSSSYLFSLELDPTNTFLSLDPVVIYIGLTFAFTGIGWLVGPSIGTAAWNLLYRNKAKQIATKDQEFYKHIVKMRADPSRQTMQNPVPDYYGEKIGSVKQYRQWLRDQASYRRKAAHGLEQDA